MKTRPSPCSGLHSVRVLELPVASTVTFFEGVDGGIICLRAAASPIHGRACSSHHALFVNWTMRAR